LFYAIDEVARRYGIAPWSIDLSDPERMKWYRRACIFMSMEGDRDEAIAKRHNRRGVN
jgi:hypothetical protein